MSRLYVDEGAYSTRGRRYLSLLQRLHRELLRSNGDQVVRLLPRLAENPLSEIPIADLIYRPGTQ